MSKLPAINEWVEFKYVDLFDIERGKGPTATKARDILGDTPYVGASALNNGITVWTNYPAIYNKNLMTIANNGSVGATFHQWVAFTASTDVTILTPKFNLTPNIGSFLKALIELEKTKYSYGRKWGITRMRKSTIKLPVRDELPDWELIENYMNESKIAAMRTIDEIVNNIRGGINE